jgi:tannase/feruloyl esterase
MKLKSFAKLSMVCLLAHAALVGSSNAVGACDLGTFSALALPNTTITLAQPMPAGANPAPVGNLSVPICRVVGIVAPSIKFEVWMPTTNWNGKFQGVGNGGFAGVVSYAAMRTALTRGYATASTDTGHAGDPAVDPVGGGLLDTRWASGHPELIVDWGHRGIHEMTVKAKAIIQGFYGSGPRFSYFTGCSGGGRQGVMEAQRYPRSLVECSTAASGGA